jgi:hypothetical protein
MERATDPCCTDAASTIQQEGALPMAQATIGSYEKFSDDALMRRYFELADHPEDHREELAAIDAVIQSRLSAAYGTGEPMASPRVRVASSI